MNANNVPRLTRENNQVVELSENSPNLTTQWRTSIRKRFLRLSSRKKSNATNSQRNWSLEQNSSSSSLFSELRRSASATSSNNLLSFSSQNELISLKPSPEDIPCISASALAVCPASTDRMSLCKKGLNHQENSKNQSKKRWKKLVKKGNLSASILSISSKFKSRLSFRSRSTSQQEVPTKCVSLRSLHPNNSLCQRSSSTNFYRHSTYESNFSINYSIPDRNSCIFLDTNCDYSIVSEPLGIDRIPSLNSESEFRYIDSSSEEENHEIAEDLREDLFNKNSKNCDDQNKNRFSKYCAKSRNQRTEIEKIPKLCEKGANDNLKDAHLKSSVKYSSRNLIYSQKKSLGIKRNLDLIINNVNGANSHNLLLTSVTTAERLCNDTYKKCFPLIQKKKLAKSQNLVKKCKQCWINLESNFQLIRTKDSNNTKQDKDATKMSQNNISEQNRATKSLIKAGECSLYQKEETTKNAQSQETSHRVLNQKKSIHKEQICLKSGKKNDYQQACINQITKCERQQAKTLEKDNERNLALVKQNLEQYFTHQLLLNTWLASRKLHCYNVNKITVGNYSKMLRKLKANYGSHATHEHRSLQEKMLVKKFNENKNVQSMKEVNNVKSTKYVTDEEDKSELALGRIKIGKRSKLLLYFSIFLINAFIALVRRIILVNFLF